MPAKSSMQGKSDTSMPLRIGSFRMCSYHDCVKASTIHAELKRQHIDAAVVDHAYILSPLQLAVALFRVESNADFKAPSGFSLFSPELCTPVGSSSAVGHSEASATAAASVSVVPHHRQIFLALSPTRNLNGILQILPPGPQTTSVVIIYAVSDAGALDDGPPGARTVDSAEDAIDVAVRDCVLRTNSTAEAHHFAPITAPFWQSPAFAFTDVSKVAQFYGISESMLLASQRSVTRADVRRVCATADSEAEQQQALRWYALEICVTTVLAACTA